MEKIKILLDTDIGQKMMILEKLQKKTKKKK